MVKTAVSERCVHMYLLSGFLEFLANIHSALAAVSNQQRAPQEIFH